MNESVPDSNKVAEVVAEWRERLLRGERFEVTEYTAKHPALADELRELFPMIVAIQDLKDEAGDLTGSIGVGATVAGGKVLERLGDFRILREVGRGGMGIVYEAEQESLGRRVALKVLPAQSMLDSHQQKRFQREAKAAAHLHHTNIVPVYGVGEHDGMLYYVMQFIQGLGLDEVLAELRRIQEARSGARITVGNPPRAKATDISAVDVAKSMLTGQFSRSDLAAAGASSNGDSSSMNGKPGTPVAPAPKGTPDAAPAAKKLAQAMGTPPRKPNGSVAGAGSSKAATSQAGRSDKSTLNESGRHYWQSVARVGLQVADAMDHAHSQGILHRDIKPSNLLLDTAGTVWVTDFGLAKAAADGDALTHTGDIVGTLRYMAPERFNGISDARGDIYSLGLTLYELVCQRPAYEEADRNKLIKQVTDGAPPQPRKLNPGVPLDLETIVLKAIDREPNRRYQTARALAEDLQRFADDKPIKARRISTAERLWRWCRRNPAVASLSAAILLLLVSLAAVSAVWAVHFQKKAEEAVTARTDAETNLKEAQRQKQLAEANFHQARRAVDDSLTKISENKLLNVPGLQPLRKELLDSALRYYEAFLRQHANDPALQKDLATAYTRVAKITADVGTKEKALTAYGQALKVRQQLLAAEPDNLELQADIAHHYQAIGRLQQDISLHVALRSLQESAALLRKIIPQSNDKVDLLSSFADVHNDIGAVYIRKNEPLEAMSYFTAALKLQRQLVDENPKHPKVARLKYELANQLNRMGSLNGDIGLPAEALKLHNEALGILRGMVSADPKNEQINDWHRALAGSHERVGDARSQDGQTATALEAYQESLPIRERLATDNPAVTDYQSDLAHAYFTIGQLQFKTNKMAPAADSFRRAIDRQKLVVVVSGSPEHSRQLGRQFARLGEVRQKLNQPADALGAYRDARAVLEKLPTPSAGDLYQTACAQAMCSLLVGNGTPEEQEQKKKDADLAVETLRHAVAAGYRDLDHVEKDPELEAVRTHKGYLAILGDLREKVKTLVWETDYDVAKARAVQEKKDLFVYFTGSDWCGWCLLVRKDVFAKEAFIDYVRRHFVMVELDFPRQKPKPKNFAQNQEMLERWGLKGFPSLILADAQGRPYASLRDGQVRDDAEAYVARMDELRKNRVTRDEHFTRAQSAEGIEKAQALDKGLSVVPTDFHSAYGEAIEQILDNDLLDKAGLRTKYLPVVLGKRRTDVQDAMRKQDWDGTILKIDKIIGELKPTGKVAADIFMDRARAQFKLKHFDKAEADFSKAIELQPGDVDLLMERAQFYEKWGKADKAAADFEAGLKPRTQQVEQARTNFARMPQDRRVRLSLSTAYKALADTQRKAGKLADAAATSLERAKLWPNHYAELYLASRELALCASLVGKDSEPTPAHEAERRRYGDQAMELLRSSAQAGMSEAAMIKDDKELTALRSRDDFKQLLSKLEEQPTLPSPENESRVFQGHTQRAIEAVAISPDSSRLLSSGYDNVVLLWDVATGRQLRRFAGQIGLIHAMAFSSDGKRVVTAGADGIVRLWDADKGTEIRQCTGHNGPVSSVAFLLDGKQIISCGRDKTIRVWDAETGMETRQLEGHQGPVTSLALSADGSRLLTGGADQSLRVWDVQAGKQLHRLGTPQEGVMSVAISRDGKLGLAGTSSQAGGSVYLWDLEKGQQLRRLDGHWFPVRAVGFTPDGKRAVSATTARGGIIISDVDTGKELHRMAPTLATGGLAVSPDGRWVATANADFRVHLWNLSADALRARQFAILGQLDKADVAYKEAVEKNAKDADLRLERARFYARQKKWNEASAGYSAALELTPRDVGLIIERIQSQASAADWNKLAADFEKSLAAFPDNPASAGSRRALFDELVKWDKAFEKTASSLPNDAQLWLARGRWLARRSEWQLATDAYARSVAAQPSKSADVFFEHACLRLLIGDVDGYRNTCAQMLKALETDKSSAIRTFLLARACTLAPGAVPDLKAIAELADDELTKNKTVYWAQTEQAALHYRMGRPDQAVPVLRQCLTAYPTWDANVLCWLWLAMAQEKLGQKDDARASREQVAQWFAKHGKEMPSKTEGTVGVHLHDWLEAHILRREAEAMARGVVGAPTSE